MEIAHDLIIAKSVGKFLVKNFKEKEKVQDGKIPFSISGQKELPSGH